MESQLGTALTLIVKCIQLLLKDRRVILVDIATSVTVVDVVDEIDKVSGVQECIPEEAYSPL